MPITDLYSKRIKKERGEMPDIFIYDKLPSTLRNQVIHIWRDALPADVSYSPAARVEYFSQMHALLCREYGVFQLFDGATVYKKEGFVRVLEVYLERYSNTERALDLIELSFQFIDTYVREAVETGYITIPISSGKPIKLSILPDEAINELNIRFTENGVGYQFESGQLIRKDSEIIHKEVVKPVLNLLRDPIYLGANEEFLKAHEHYRHQHYKECINECLKSFESVMKTICDKRGWTYDQNDTASKLIKACFDNGLLPSHLQTQFNSLKSTLESGVPTVRNRTSGHGQGVTQNNPPLYVAQYALNLTATTILFLVEAEKALS